MLLPTKKDDFVSAGNVGKDITYRATFLGKRVEQVEANAKAVEWKLTADEVAEVSALLG